MTDAEHAAVLRRRLKEWDHPYDEEAAIERAIELLEREERVGPLLERIDKRLAKWGTS